MYELPHRDVPKGASRSGSANAVGGQTTGNWRSFFHRRDRDGGQAVKIPRRKFMHLVAGGTALPAMSHFAWALDYPTRPVHLIVGLAAGGPTDVIARIVAQWLSERMGRQFPVENRTGAGGSLATQAVINAPPDGYTLLFAGPTVTIGAALYRKLSNVLEELTPISGVMRFPNLMVVAPSLPVTTAVTVG